MKVFTLIIMILLCTATVYAPDGEESQEFSEETLSQLVITGADVVGRIGGGTATITGGTLTAIGASGNNINIESANVEFQGAAVIQVRNIEGAQMTGDVIQGTANENAEVGEYKLEKGTKFKIDKIGRITIISSGRYTTNGQSFSLANVNSQDGIAHDPRTGQFSVGTGSGTVTLPDGIQIILSNQDKTSVNLDKNGRANKLRLDLEA